MSESSGDGDGDPTDSAGDGDGDTAGDGDGDTAGDGDGDDGSGCFNCPCGPNGECDEGLSCNPDTMTCDLGGGGDGDGDPGTDTNGAEDPWDPGTCAPPSQSLMLGGVEGTFCGAPCVSSADCPAAPPNTQGQCAIITMEGGDPEFCALVCTPGSEDCPTGSTCKDVPNQMGVGLCTYP